MPYNHAFLWHTAADDYSPTTQFHFYHKLMQTIRYSKLLQDPVFNFLKYFLNLSHVTASELNRTQIYLTSFLYFEECFTRYFHLLQPFPHFSFFVFVFMQLCIVMFFCLSLCLALCVCISSLFMLGITTHVDRAPFKSCTTQQLYKSRPNK